MDVLPDVIDMVYQPVVDGMASLPPLVTQMQKLSY